MHAVLALRTTSRDIEAPITSVSPHHLSQLLKGHLDAGSSPLFLVSCPYAALLFLLSSAHGITGLLYPWHLGGLFKGSTSNEERVEGLSATSPVLECFFLRQALSVYSPVGTSFQSTAPTQAPVTILLPCDLSDSRAAMMFSCQHHSVTCSSRSPRLPS